MTSSFASQPDWLADSRALLSEALQRLGVKNLVLGIHDQSHPSLPDEDIGRGSPYSDGALQFLQQIAQMGVTGIQFGPQGQTSESNASPYDGTVFSKSTLNLPLARLLSDPRWSGLLSQRTFESIRQNRPEGRPHRVSYRYVYGAIRGVVRELHQTFVAKRDQGDPQATALAERLTRFKLTNAHWLERDMVYAALTAEYLGAHWSRWPVLDQQLLHPQAEEKVACAARLTELRTRRASEMERHALGQLLVHELHAELRERIQPLGLKLFGDLQVGLSTQDCWSYSDLFLTDYAMGAPPSRTNPEGQAWNYPVLDPRLLVAADGKSPGPAMELFGARVSKMLSEFDGIRVDHPHGLVCPWVYRTQVPDLLRSVRDGARLYDSPALPDHPGLAAYAIPLLSQLNPNALRYADDWVKELTQAQVDRYSLQMDRLVHAIHQQGRDVSDLVCEVLSTMPYPLARVLDRYSLGRFRVTQKASLKEPKDVYRSENAQPTDWIMVGNHDTSTIWKLAAGWKESGLAKDQAGYLAQRLKAPSEQPAFAAHAASDLGGLVTAKFADLFASKAQNVMIFFADWFGFTEIYNTPGMVSDDNWSLRLSTDWQKEYRTRLAAGTALNLPAALAMALRAPGAVQEPLGAPVGELADRLDQLAKRWAAAPASS